VILEIAKTDQLDIISGDAVMLKLVGLSNSAVDMILHRRLKGQRTMSSAEIGRLKNTGLTEKNNYRAHQFGHDRRAGRQGSGVSAKPHAIIPERIPEGARAPVTPLSDLNLPHCLKSAGNAGLAIRIFHTFLKSAKPRLIGICRATRQAEKSAHCFCF